MHTSVITFTSECALDKSIDSIGPITDTIKAMNGETLRDNLKRLGFEAGPITPSTHTVYMKHLLRLRRKPCHGQEDQSALPQYCKELCLLLRQPSSIPWEAWTALEEKMSHPFSRPDPTRHWRNGTSKSCFNYLLLDPRITQNLPIIIKKFKRFKKFGQMAWELCHFMSSRTPFLWRPGQGRLQWFQL